MIREKMVFSSPLPLNQVRAEVTKWLQVREFKPTSPGFLSEISFERGSIWGCCSSFCPRTWKTILDVAFTKSEHGTVVELRWQIWTTGQVVTKNDISYLQMEVRQIQSVIAGTPPDLKAMLAAQQRNANRNLVLAMIATVPMVFACILGFFDPAHFVPLFAAGAVVGVLFCLALRAPRTLLPAPLPGRSV